MNYRNEVKDSNEEFKTNKKTIGKNPNGNNIVGMNING